MQPYQKKKKQKKNVKFEADWEAFNKWKFESERRERKRLKAFNALGNIDPVKDANILSTIHQNTVCPCLSEVLRKSLDPGLDSAPPPAPPAYVQQPSQSNAAHVSADMTRGQQPDSSTETTSSPAVTRLQSQQGRVMLQEERGATALMPMKEGVGAEGPQETCSFCLSHLTTALDTQCSFTGHSPRGTQTLEQCKDHLEERFVSGTRPKLRQMVRKSYVPLTDVLKHAEHAKAELHRKEMLAMINTLARQIRNIPPWQRGRTRGGGKRRSRNNDPDVCHCCGKRGHWQADCPEKQTGPATARLTEGRGGRGGPQRWTASPQESR
ncbi:uncharacterized protein LOC130197041 isoform X2 [Pseudoliparis swirei]|uniref:uncharacterized protein LOC130197041 isoform X2 n=1 Tax=Pseudoliparis swirei TaxID=2059687 RepID=UPI0024BD9340|nr:uncharacterized protein LOC130197041 isoform X2 [Pseudoliparis swirei]